MLGRLDDAESALQAALADNTALGARPEVVACHLELAGLLLQRARDGDLEKGASSAATAAAEARRLDMPGPLARADALLAHLSAARRRANPLSAREAEVARLLLQALPNREIARTLALSERTIESHVSAILRKSGVTNRTEYLARYGPRRPADR
jgi:DNA-binding NarL/FixJ family response regulator